MTSLCPFWGYRGYTIPFSHVRRIHTWVSCRVSSEAVLLNTIPEALIGRRWDVATHRSSSSSSILIGYVRLGEALEHSPNMFRLVVDVPYGRPPSGRAIIWLEEAALAYETVS